MSVISLVIAPALKSLQYDKQMGTIDWEWRSVIIGSVMLVILFAVLFQIQRAIDKGYDVKRKEVTIAQAQEKKDAKNAAAAIKAAELADPVGTVFAAVRKLLSSNETTAALADTDMEKFKEYLVEPVVKTLDPVESKKIEVMEVEKVADKAE